MPSASVPCANYVNVEGLFNRDGTRYDARPANTKKPTHGRVLNANCKLSPLGCIGTRHSVLALQRYTEYSVLVWDWQRGCIDLHLTACFILPVILRSAVSSMKTST